MTGAFDDRCWLSGIDKGHRLVLAYESDHFAIRAPASGLGVIRNISEGNHGLFASILIDIPNLYSLVYGAC